MNQRGFDCILGLTLIGDTKNNPYNDGEAYDDQDKIGDKFTGNP
jgi:hypothetical protein